jgi:hypothetical protein
MAGNPGLCMIDNPDDPGMVCMLPEGHGPIGDPGVHFDQAGNEFVIPLPDAVLPTSPPAPSSAITPPAAVLPAAVLPAIAAPTAPSVFKNVAEPERDRWGRPLIIQQDGSKPVAYTRITTMAKQTDDTSNLMNWKLRLAGKGLAMRMDLLSAAMTMDLEADKKEFNRVMEQAFLASGGDSAARLGTALHKAAQRVDEGNKVTLPPQMMEDLEAYQRATAVMKHLYIERMVVLDEVRVAGTPDRISMTPWSDRPVIVDIKTGKDMSFGQQAISAQLAAGAWGRLYDPETGSRVDLGCDKDFGIVVHVPVGQAKATLYRVDLRRGTQILGVSTQVHAIRSMKNLMVKMAG